MKEMKPKLKYIVLVLLLASCTEIAQDICESECDDDYDGCVEECEATYTEAVENDEREECRTDCSRERSQCNSTCEEFDNDDTVF